MPLRAQRLARSSRPYAFHCFATIHLGCDADRGANFANKRNLKKLEKQLLARVQIAAAEIAVAAAVRPLPPPVGTCANSCATRWPPESHT
jgi:hypothetical protein